MSGPLSHIRVMDFGHSWAGPYTGMMLRDLGAEVIKIESSEHVEILRWSSSFVDGLRDPERCGWFAVTNRGKKSLTVNLKHPEAANVLLELAEQCDVIIENFAPEILERIGLPLSRFRERNPKLVTISMYGYGATGPQRDFRSFGDHLLHASGIASLTGDPEDDHTRIGIFYGDPVGAMYGTLAILAALRERERTGTGRSLELSQVEGLVSMIPTAVMSVGLGRDMARSADANAKMHPHGFYRCAGDDTWVAIAVRGDDRWRSFRELLESNGHAVCEFPTLAERVMNASDINQAVSAWTAALSPWQVTDACQAIGIAAYPVLSAPKLLFDDHLNQREFFSVVKRPIVGAGPIPGVVFRFNGSGARVRGYAPLLGEHNHSVCRELLGMSDEQIESAVASGLLR